MLAGQLPEFTEWACRHIWPLALISRFVCVLIFAPGVAFGDAA